MDYPVYKTYTQIYDERLPYAEKLKYLDDNVRMPGSSIEGEDLMRVLTLICHVTMVYREKVKVAAKAKGETPKAVTPMHILVNACGKGDGSLNLVYERLSLHCDLLISHDAKFDNYGAANVKDMMSEIKRTVEGWLPF